MPDNIDATTLHADRISLKVSAFLGRLFYAPPVAVTQDVDGLAER
jgi:hypothetical protein